ncbi:lysozyme-like domain-containing protein [Triangularia verruculosa]|uniref:Lysozyme-like domain-containing protein n=1 Tax=Triangularia verruculosa TaxID=2587418 RepID=A0AAN6X8F5_9PEZI|nr:lysozyme-like domain-containing protein [Triangularia verruculosa]
MKFAALVAIAAPASAYLITGSTVNCRTGPGTSYAVKKTYTEGQDVSITCQTPGTAVNGNSIWDKTTDGCYVADYYVKTGTNGYVTTKCTVCSAPKSNQATVDLIAEFEGFVANIYLDPVGLPTVGYGHLCSDSKCSEVRAKYSIPLSQANGKKLLAEDMARFEKCITNLSGSKVTLNLNQYGALVSWSYNVGCGAAESSTLMNRLNNGESAATVLPQELPKWKYAGGSVLPGLVRRREAEIALARTSTTAKAIPRSC